MRLIGDKTVLTLEPVGYEFPSGSEGWDANWVVIAGTAAVPEGTWSFRQASLTTWEAKVVSSWLRLASEGSVEPVLPDDEGFLTPSLTFTEPDLGFSIASQENEVVELRVHLTHGFAPPWLDIDERLNTWQFFVSVPMPTGALTEAADAWDQEWLGLPERP